MSNEKIHVWTCKIVVVADDLPAGFDFPPRMAAEKAIAELGSVIMNRSGWGGEHANHIECMQQLACYMK